MSKNVMNLQTGMLTVEEYTASELASIAAAQPTLAQVKASKIAEIEAKRDEATNADAAALGTLWQADERSQKLLSSAITLAQAGLNLPAVWRDALNNNLAITSLSQLLSIAGAMAVQTDAAYTKSWLLKTQIVAAATVADVDAVVW